MPARGAIIENDFITCGRCSLKFERDKSDKHCSNCFACTGCEVYYCPRCDNEIVITPRKTAGSSTAAQQP